MPVGAAGDFHGVQRRRSDDDAAFFGHSKDIERPSPALLFVISAGPHPRPSECEHLCDKAFAAMPLQEGNRGELEAKAFRTVDWGTCVEPKDVTRRLRA